MPLVLVDTWFFVAHFNRRDPDHDSAARMWRRMDQAQMVTHDGVLAEFLTFFAEFGPTIREKAARIGPLIQGAFGRAYKGGVNIAFGTDSGVFEHGRNGEEAELMVGISGVLCRYLSRKTPRAKQ